MNCYMVTNTLKLLFYLEFARSIYRYKAFCTVSIIASIVFA
ncbi:hypothetical protein PROVALCAL_01416 [Providencia alcalifaciens DSM 30120]|uniref:Uncharacterized protein n=1 Tax=Providencia alcalifaciens DSM 30120 TaxID=520999 RepID=B6XDJ4_9GAMM|nr:hypothetical protein PROVALCAL_01416 [Providencia alcalifaciens DSM 30120]